MLARNLLDITGGGHRALDDTKLTEIMDGFRGVDHGSCKMVKKARVPGGTEGCKRKRRRVGRDVVEQELPRVPLILGRPFVSEARGLPLIRLRIRGGPSRRA